MKMFKHLIQTFAGKLGMVFEKEEKKKNIVMENYREFKGYSETSNAAYITRENLKRILGRELKDVKPNYPLCMVDVGTSDGEMSLPLIQWLKEGFVNLRYVAIEPEKPAFDELNHRIKNLGIDYAEIHNVLLEDLLKNTKIGKDGFDLILFSQVFYHLPKKEWDGIFEDLKRLLRRKGLVVIVLDSDKGSIYGLKDIITSGKNEIVEFGDLFFAEDIEAFLVRKVKKYDLRSFIIRILIQDNEQKLSEVARILAFLYRTSAEKILSGYVKELEEFLKEVKQGNWYILESLVKLIIFRKESLL